MDKKKRQILATGLSGMVGSRVVEILEPAGFEFVEISREKGVDISNGKSLDDFFKSFTGDWVLHIAAKTDVDGCEKDKKGDIERLRSDDILGLAFDKIRNTAGGFVGLGSAWTVNVVGTYNIAFLCKKYGKKLIYISTDFVFDGKKDEYGEGDEVNPVNWYGMTKFIGERVVSEVGIEHIICRIAFPYRARFTPKLDLVRFLLGKMERGEDLVLVQNQVITPTFADDIAGGIRFLIDKEARGLFHLVGSNSVAPIELASAIAGVFGLKMGKVSEIKRADFYKGKAVRPFKLRLVNDKIKKLGFKPAGIESGLLTVKKQLEGEL